MLELRLLANGVALPLALQAIYVICLPLARARAKER